LSPKLYSAEEKQIARDILSYLKKHPEAKDTLDGITQWWLLEEWNHRMRLRVQNAVSFLLSKDLIFETQRQGSPPYYQLNRQKRAEIAKILKEFLRNS
jgi:hypothetical protein